LRWSCPARLPDNSATPRTARIGNRVVRTVLSKLVSRGANLLLLLGRYALQADIEL
jgi:hypothetical protein